MSARYEDDPRWQEAHARHCAERGPDESAAEHFARGWQAAMDKFHIECEYEDATA